MRKKVLDKFLCYVILVCMGYKDEELINLREAAAFLRVCPRTVARYRMDGLLPFFKYSSRKILFKVGDLKAFQERSYCDACDYAE